MNSIDDARLVTGEGLLEAVRAAPPQDDPRVIQALEDYLAALEAGQKPDRLAFLAQHGEIAPALAKALNGLEFIQTAAPQLPRSSGDEPVPSPGIAAEVCPECHLGDFRILREVGKGGMGVVYEAEQVSLRRRVALKVLPFAATMDSRHLRRFQNEAQAAACLHHTNIVPVYSVGCERGVHFYAMQYVQGRTLADLIAELRQQSGRDTVLEGSTPASAVSADPKRTGPYRPEAIPKRAGDTTVGPAKDPSSEHSTRSAEFFRTVAELGIQAADALEHAHQLGIVHRDIKPGNLLVEGEPGVSPPGVRLWVTDFGLAHCQGQAGLTMSGDLVGTLRYMSPEQALARRVAVDHRTDLYSLGVTLYELLTLEPAFGGQDRQELLRQIAFDEPRPPRRLNRAVPAELETIVGKAMEKNPADRYATAQELADDLERFLKDEPIRARRPTLVQRARKWARRHKATVWAAAASLFVTLLALGVSLGWAARDQAARAEALDQVVAKLLEDTEPLLAQGRWPEALALADRAEKLLATAGRKDRPPRLAALQIELSLAERLEGIHGDPNAAEEQFFWGRTQEGRYSRAFREFGIDVEALTPEEVAARIGATRIPQALVQALDRWAAMRKRSRRYADPLWQKLVETARRADGDEWRNQLREAVLSKDRVAMEKLAGSVPLREVPPATAYLVENALEELGAPDKALAVLREAHRHHPDDFWLNDGLAFLSTICTPPRWADAVRYYQAAVVLRPRSWRMHFFLANALDHMGAHDEANAEWDKSVEMGSENAEFYIVRGDLFVGNHKYDKALSDLSKAIELYPKLAVARDIRGIAYLQLRQYDKALADLSRAIELDPKHVVFCSRGAAYLQLHQYDEALADLTKAIQLDPKCASAWCNRGLAYNNLHQHDKGLADYSKAIELDPKNAEVWNDLAWQLATCPDLRLRDPARAVVHAKKAVELAPDAGTYWNTLGVAQCRNGSWKAAVEALRKSVQLRQGGDSADFFFLAMAHWQLDEKDKARAWYDRAVTWMDKNKPQDEELKRFRAEATALLGLAKVAQTQTKNE